MTRDAVGRPPRPRVDSEPLLEARLERQGQRRMHPAAKRRVDTYPPVPNLVAEALDHDRAVVWDGAGGGGLIVQVREQVLDSAIIESGARPQAIRGLVRFDRPRLAGYLAQRQPQLNPPARRVRMPEGDPPRLPRGGGDEHLRRADFRDAPRGGA